MTDKFLMQDLLYKHFIKTNPDAKGNGAKFKAYIAHVYDQSLSTIEQVRAWIESEENI